MNDTPDVSVVIPVYGCGGCLRRLHTRLVTALGSITPAFEIILVDDRSPDGAWEVMKEIGELDPRVRVLRLSRNFGQHAAITAGLTRSRGRWTVVMDCDLEEPPEEIPRLYLKAQEGYDIVRAARLDRKVSSARRSVSRVYRYVFLESDRTTEYGTLSIISRKVVDAFLSLRERDREYQMMLDWLGFTQATIPFVHEERGSGTSSYTPRRLLKVAFDGMFFRTTVLLRLIVLLGFLVATAGAGLAAYAVYARYTAASPSGYTSIVVILLVLSGFIIVSLGVVGLYVGRIFDQVKERPLFVVDEDRAPAREPDPIAGPLA
jgi:glycosyltransferase involved in cell wall biosynthesis